jgi:hypothetical protein
MELIRIIALILLLAGSGLSLAGHAGVESDVYIGVDTGGIENEYYDQSNFDDVSMASTSSLCSF